jgi:Bacterial PH domain
MGLFDNFKQKADAKAQAYIESILLPGETIKELITTGADFMAITEKRLILCDQDFDWGDSKQAVFSLPINKIIGVSVSNPISGVFKKFRVAVHAGGVTARMTFLKEDEARKAFIVLNSIIA